MGLRTYLAAFIAVVPALLLTSCASLNPLDFFKDEPKIETNLNVGKNVQQEQSKLKIEQGKTEQKADNISNDTQYSANKITQITQNIPIWYLLLAVLLGGWVIPSPKECYSGVKVLTTELFNGIIITPVKGIANFILVMFGREKL